jgi:hypothetical protein
MSICITNNAGGIKVQYPRCFAGQYRLFIGEMPEASKSNIPGDIRGSKAKLLYNPGEG